MGLPNSVKLQQQALIDKLAAANETMVANGSLDQTEDVKLETAKLQNEIDYITPLVIEANSGEILNHVNALLGDAKALIEKFIPWQCDTEDPAASTMSAESLAAESCNNMLTVEQTQKLITFMVDVQERFKPDINVDITTPTGKLNNIIHMKNVIEDNLEWPQFNETLTDQQRAYLQNAKDLAISYITENGSPSAEADYINAVIAQNS